MGSRVCGVGATHVIIHLQCGDDSFICLDQGPDDILVFYELRRVTGWLMGLVKGRYLYVPDDGLAGCLGILETFLNAGISGDTLFVAVDQCDRVDQIARCLTGVGNRCQYLGFLLKRV